MNGQDVHLIDPPEDVPVAGRHARVMRHSLLLLLAIGCSSGPPLEPRASSPEERRALAAEVVKLTAASCASCHTRSSPSADPAALAIFDYERADWPSMLDEERLHSFRGRARGGLAELDRETLDRFISGELGLRGHGQPSP
jgi:hypothetical protein